MLLNLSEFDPDQPLYVVRPFKGHGRNWETGDEFYWKKGKTRTPIRRVHQMYMRRYLTHTKLFSPTLEMMDLGMKPHHIEALSNDELAVLKNTTSRETVIAAMADIAAARQNHEIAGIIESLLFNEAKKVYHQNVKEGTYNAD